MFLKVLQEFHWTTRNSHSFPKSSNYGPNIKIKWSGERQWKKKYKIKEKLFHFAGALFQRIIRSEAFKLEE